ncbi:MAG: ABC transporter ATP-binding protein [Saccharofermentanales bacterium]
MEKIIKASGINKIFKTQSGDDLHVLHDIDIEIEPGKVTLLKGPSGSGKTTLMNIMGSLEPPTSGSVFYNGEDIYQYGTKKTDLFRRDEISYIFQSISLLSSLTAYENIEFMLRNARQPISKERITYCLEQVGLTQRINHSATMLSGGEQQRVAIARAISHHPKLIFADEPTSRLDSATSVKIMELLKRLCREENLTVVMASHDDIVAQACDIIHYIEDGRFVLPTGG